MPGNKIRRRQFLAAASVGSLWSVANLSQFCQAPRPFHEGGRVRLCRYGQEGPDH